MQDALSAAIKSLLEMKTKVRRGIPWHGRPTPPDDFTRYRATPTGDGRHVLGGRIYDDTGAGWRALNKPTSRRKRRILAKQTAPGGSR